ncbi:MAG: undecaprenyldiphospho-muramoylpentapeptide beta-N-acetylglucosaminyltransferase [Gammaproteobacteria bacterium]
MIGILIGGGTGGHVFPALAVAEKLKSDSHKVIWVGRKHSLEENISKNSNIPFEELETRGFRGKGVFYKISSIFILILSFFRSLKILYRLKPDFVFSFGGYTSLPIGFASYVLNIPLFIHEQNSVMGSANRILNLLSKKTFLGFPLNESKNKYIVSGNPIRKKILSISSQPKDSNCRSILILGGSQGSVQLNNLVIKAIREIEGLEGWTINHQSGKYDKEKIKKVYLEKNINHNVEDFFEDIEKYYRDASFVVSRSGALTVSEILFLNIPSIFLPLPWAIDDHQYHNAMFLNSIGLSEVVEAKEENLTELKDKIQQLVSSQEKRKKMENSAKLLNNRNTLNLICSSLYESLTK